jgi:hypothetical protein
MACLCVPITCAPMDRTSHHASSSSKWRNAEVSRWRPLLFWLFCLSPLFCSSQNDSLELYKKIHEKAEKHKVTRMLYDAIFSDPVPEDKPATGKVVHHRVDKNIRYKGRRIRDIRVRVLDPFGHSVDDTAKVPSVWLQRAGNSLHVSTRAHVIRDLLLFREGDKLDPLRITESERVLRASPIVNDARIVVTPVKGSKSEVEIMVFVLDLWSIDGGVEGDLTGVSGTARDRNLFGEGHELEQGVAYDADNNLTDWQGHYAIYNIKRSFIGARLFYLLSDATDNVGLAFDRGFYSPLTRWAGGVLVEKSWIKGQLYEPSLGTAAPHEFRPVHIDTWLARAFVLDRDTSDASRSSKIILGSRYDHVQYAERPSPGRDTLGLYANTKLYLMSVGFSVRQYYKERYLYRFGLSEDVPEGLLTTVTLGAQSRAAAAALPYVGLEVSRGLNTDRFGYASIALGYGMFTERGQVEESVLRGELTYFTNAHAMGRWRLRQFARFHAVHGFSQPAHRRLTLGGEELYGFDQDVVYGQRKDILNLETVVYAPFNLLGFRFAPVLLIGFGSIGPERSAPLDNKIYSAWSLGLMVRNENLITKTFEVSVGYYPELPDGTRNVFRLNPAISFTLGARDFAFPKPYVIGF